MKIVIAPDSFKGSLTSIQVAKAMKQAVLETVSTCDVQTIPMADGGEGTLDALLFALNGERVPATCTGPLGEKIKTSYGIVNERTAIIEGASISGLPQVPPEQRNPDNTTSFGIGEVIHDALNKGCESIILGLGGSATNDGGLGMLQALGMKALDQAGKEVGPFGRDLLNITKIDLKNLDPRLTSINIKIANDVDNPLCGKRGASAVYGPQKGATAEQVQQYDQAMAAYADLIEKETGYIIKDTPGAGAAGGLGFALLTLGAELVSGAAFIADAVNLEHHMKDANLVLTGEGQSDEQTLYGKAPGYVAELAKKHHIPAILISGGLAGNLAKLNEKFAGCFSIINRPMSLQACMDDAKQLLINQTKQVIHFWRSI